MIPKETFAFLDSSIVNLSIDGEDNYLIWPHDGLVDPIGANIRLEQEIKDKEAKAPIIYFTEDRSNLEMLALENRFANLTLEIRELTEIYRAKYLRWVEAKFSLKLLWKLLLFILATLIVTGSFCLLNGTEAAPLGDLLNWNLIFGCFLGIACVLTLLLTGVAKASAGAAREDILALIGFYYKNVDSAKNHHNILHEHPIRGAIAELLSRPLP